MVNKMNMKMKMKIPTEKGRYYNRIWLELYDGGSGEWLYVCRTGLTYFFIRVMDFVDACGRDADHQWVGDVNIVDLVNTDAKTVAQAIRSCGLEDADLDLGTELGRLSIAEAMNSYGAHSPMWSGSALPLEGRKPYDGGNDEKHPAFRTLRAEARRQAEELFDDEVRNHELDNKIVNKLGQTAREYSNGTSGLFVSLRKIKDLGEDASPEQKLMLKIYQKAETTLGGDKIPSDL